MSYRSFWRRLAGRARAMAPTYLISSDLEALIEGAEPLEAVVHGDGTGRFLGGVAFPTAEAGDDPAGPGEGVSGMRIALFFRAPLKVRLQGVERRDFVGGEGAGLGTVPSRAWTSCRTIAAECSAASDSFIRPPAVST